MFRSRVRSAGVLCLLTLICLAACSPGLTPDEKKVVQSEQEPGVVGYIKTLLSRYFFASSLSNRPDRVFPGHTSIVWNVDFSPDGKTLASGSADKNIIIWNVDTGVPVHTLRAHQEAIMRVAFSPDGKTLASGGKDKVIHLHFFIGGCDWYIAEYSPEEDLFWGYAILNGDTEMAEWGYISFKELRELVVGPGIEVDRDLHWEPRAAGEISKIAKL